jgi:tRNA A-37 threonylcarbamoyl transferase component Bud32
VSGVAQRVVGRYEILREIGQGGMATVHLARQIDLDRLVALKELRALRNDDPSLVHRFLREARLAGSLTHPNIVTVHDYFEDGGAPHIAMEYMARGSLRPYVGRLSPAHVGRMLEGLLAGLAEAERHDIVHRDIKPENLLVTADGGVKIADFGIAKATKVLEESVLLTATGMTVGTPSYIAPEQAMARDLGPWTDLYAVGVTTFELFAGRTPFSDTQEPMAIVLRQINEPIPPLTQFVPNADPWLSRWIEWLVAKDPARRPQSAREAWDGLEEVLIRLLGPRWRRNAHEPLAPVTPPTAQARPVADPRLAGTAAPRRRRTPVASSAPAPPVRRKGRGRPNVAKVGALVGVLTAGAILFGKSGGLPTAPASHESTVVTSPATTTSTPRVQTAAASEAFGLAKTYRRAAAGLAGRRGTQVTKLRSAFKQTAAAYERAGAAATTGDVAAYNAALADAAVHRQTIATVGTSVPHVSTPATTTTAPRAAPRRVAPATSPPASSTPTRTAPTSAPTTTAPAQTTPASGCEGDSQSDDPSDDACNP